MGTKIVIKGVIELKTGMHIGGSELFSQIGAVDSPVVRDARTKLPMIPGSSLKGKLRSLLAHDLKSGIINSHDDDPVEVKRLFGSQENKSRLIFTDTFLSNLETLSKQGVSATEVKFENTINRLTAEANPRQIERAVRGSEFPLEIIYDLTDTEEFAEDMENIQKAFKLLSYDYLGGSGTRGYGKVIIQDLIVEPVVGTLTTDQAKALDIFTKEG